MKLVQRELTVGAQSIAYYQEGPSTRSILFIHGNSSCKAAFEDQYSALLEAGYGVLAFDLPGHGASSDAPNPEADYNLPAYADLAAAFCEASGVTQPLLCGWSLGGHIAIQMAGNNPDYAGLMIFGTPPIGLNPHDAANAFLSFEFSDVTGQEHPSDAQLAGYIAAVYGSTPTIPGALVKAGQRTDGRSRSCMVAHWLTGENLHDQRAIVEHWRNPLLIVHGAEDAFVSGDYLRSLDLPQDRPGSAIKMIENVGHAPFLEDPETFNRLLLDFCASSFS